MKLDYWIDHEWITVYKAELIGALAGSSLEPGIHTRTFIVPFCAVERSGEYRFFVPSWGFCHAFLPEGTTIN